MIVVHISYLFIYELLFKKNNYESSNKCTGHYIKKKKKESTLIIILSFQSVLHNWCNKGCGMCYPVCGMVHIKEPLLLIDE